MWKRLQTKRHPQIGNPTLLETTLDERAYPDLQDGGTPGKAPSQHNGQPRILPKGLPSLPLYVDLLSLLHSCFHAGSVMRCPVLLLTLYIEPPRNPLRYKILLVVRHLLFILSPHRTRKLLIFLAISTSLHLRHQQLLIRVTFRRQALRRLNQPSPRGTFKSSRRAFVSKIRSMS